MRKTQCKERREERKKGKIQFLGELGGREKINTVYRRHKKMRENTVHERNWKMHKML